MTKNECYICSVIEDACMLAIEHLEEYGNPKSVMLPFQKLGKAVTEYVMNNWDWEGEEMK